MEQPTAAQVTSRELKRVLSEKRWTRARAARELGVTARTVTRWTKGEIPLPVDKAALLAVKAETPVQLVFGGHEETAPPVWVRRLLGGLIALEKKEGITPDELDRAVAEALAYLVATPLKRPPRASGGGSKKKGA